MGVGRTGPGLTESCQTSQVGLEEVVELWGSQNWSRPYWKLSNKSGRTRGGSRVVGGVRTGAGLTGSCQTSQVGLEEVVKLWGVSELVQALLEAVKQVR